MKKKLAILLLIIGILISNFFLLLILSYISNGFEFKYFEWDLIFKCTVVVFIGFFIAIIGAILLESKKSVKSTKKEKWMNQLDGKTFITLGGDYQVGYSKAAFYLEIFVILFWIGMWVFLLVEIYMQNGRMDYFLLYISLLFICLFVCIAYFLRRPRIQVKGDQLTIYPRWEKQKVIHLTDIDERRIRRSWQAQFIITYYKGKEELFNIHSNFINWKRLDMNIYVYLSYKKNQKKDD